MDKDTAHRLLLIGRLIVRARLLAGYRTQVDAEQASGISRTIWQELERGKARALQQKPETRMALSQFLGWPPDQLGDLVTGTISVEDVAGRLESGGDELLARLRRDVAAIESAPPRARTQ